VKNKDVQIGQHCWAILSEKLLVVLKIEAQEYNVCGEWECSIDADKLEILQIIDKPKGYKNTGLYYLDEYDDCSGCDYCEID